MIENCMASRLTFHLAEQLLNGEALSKKELAIELNISYRALLRLYSGKQSENDVVAIMSGIALYCLRERIPTDRIKAKLKGLPPALHRLQSLVA